MAINEQNLKTLNKSNKQSYRSLVGGLASLIAGGLTLGLLRSDITPIIEDAPTFVKIVGYGIKTVVMLPSIACFGNSGKAFFNQVNKYAEAHDIAMNEVSFVISTETITNEQKENYVYEMTKSSKTLKAVLKGELKDAKRGKKDFATVEERDQWISVIEKVLNKQKERI